MTVEAMIVKDSVAYSNGVRLTTFLLRYPKFIHAELMTHRAFSRNASSSRAIPINKMIRDVMDDMAQPLEFRKKKKGMQAGDPFGPRGQQLCRGLWRAAGLTACGAAWLMEKLGVHKQYANRLIEPFAHITVVVTATELANWFALRNHEAAQPEIRALAKCMWELWLRNFPQQLQFGQWHLPFVDDFEMIEAWHLWKKDKTDPKMVNLIKKSVACCARTSYKNHDKTSSTQEENNGLHDKLVAENPKHASPAEHQASPMLAKQTGHMFSGNLRGWNQYRKMLPGENVNVYPEKPDYLKEYNPFAYHPSNDLVGLTYTWGGAIPNRTI